MNPKESADWIKDLCLEAGFNDVGIASATINTPKADFFLQAMADDRLKPLDYMERTKEVRADVQKLMPGAKSVVVVVKNYYTGDHHDFADSNALNEGAKISRYGWGGDYHHWFKKRLRRLRTSIESKFGPGVRVHIFNDTGPVLERAWAEQAGLGFIGKSGMFIHRKFGTWTFLGGFVTDLELTPDKPSIKQHCGSCTACMDACPTKAIVAPGAVDARRCLTTWNVERPHSDEASQSAFSGHGWALGCDRCQEVCPWNKFEQLSEDERFKPRFGTVVLTPESIPIDLRGTSLARPGKEGLLMSIGRAKRP